MDKTIKPCCVCRDVLFRVEDGFYTIFCSCGRGSVAKTMEDAITVWNAEADNRSLAEKSRYYKKIQSPNQK